MYRDRQFDFVTGGRREMNCVPIVSGFIRRVVEDLQELTPPQMEHELRVNHEVVVESETARIVLPVLCKLLTQPDQHPIQPPQHVGTVIDLCFEHCDPRHQDRRCLLIEVVANRWVARLCEIPRDRRHS